MIRIMLCFIHLPPFQNMHMRKLVFAICLAAANSCFAQTAVDLNPVTITATRLPQKQNETGRSITVIDGKLFDKLAVRSLDELLKYVPGIEMQSRGPMGAQSDIVIRGGTFQQVLIMIDGVRMNDPVTGHFSSYIPVAPYEIERIEILRGPAAAMYGAEAVGGVINIITKAFNKFTIAKSNHETATLTAGQYGLWSGNAGLHTTGKKVNTSFGFLTNNTTGQLLRGNNRGYVYNNTISGSISFHIAKNWQLSLRSSYDSRSFAAQNFYTTFKSDTATEKVKTWWNQLQLKQQTGNHTQQFDLMYKKTTDHYAYNTVAIANDNKSEAFLFQYLYSTQLNKQLQFGAGTQLDKRSIISNDRGNHSAGHGAVFTTLIYSQKQFKLSPSLRVDKDENYGTAFIPQLNASYQLNNTTLRALVGKSIRNADFTERYNNYNKKLVTSGSIGNPDLSTENGWSYELGADVLSGNHLKVSVTGFYRNQNNVIDYVATPYADMPRKSNLSPAGNYALAKNIKKVTTRGAEAEVTWQKAFSNTHRLYINTGLTLLHSGSSDTVPSFYIISHAKLLAQANVLYTFKRVSLSVSSLYKTRNAQKASGINAVISSDYFLLNAQASYQLCKKLAVSVMCNNITDKSYSDLLGSIMPRRWLSGSIVVNP